MCGIKRFFFLLFDVCMLKSLLALTRLYHICLTELKMKMRSSDKAIGQQPQIKLASIRLKSCSLWSTLGRDVRCVHGCPDWLLTLILLNKTELLSNLLPQSLPHPPSLSPLHEKEVLIQVDYVANWVRVETGGWIWVFQNKHKVEELAHLSVLEELEKTEGTLNRSKNNLFPLTQTFAFVLREDPLEKRMEATGKIHLSPIAGS